MTTDDATTTEGVLIDAMARALYERDCPHSRWVERSERMHDTFMGLAEVALAALLVPTVEADCPTCGGPRSRYMADCSRCNQGKVQVRALDVWLAEQGDQ